MSHPPPQGLHVAQGQLLAALLEELARLRLDAMSCNRPSLIAGIDSSHHQLSLRVERRAHGLEGSANLRPSEQIGLDGQTAELQPPLQRLSAWPPLA